MKKRMAILVICTVVFSACYRQSYTNKDNFTVEPTEDGRSLAVLKYNGQDQVSISVPPRIDGKRVTEIGEGAFADLEIISMTIPSGIETIGAWSFSGNFIADFIIPKAVTRIDEGAFMDNRLSHITIPNSVRRIGYRAFCDNPLKSITIGADVELESIGGYDTEKEEDWAYWAFELGLEEEFDVFYIRNGKKAGTYVLTDGVWTMQGK